MKTPLLTIGMPIYMGGRNEGALLIRCLESLKNQTFKDFKVIISNNNSTDNTEGIIYKTVKDDKRFEYHRNEDNFGFFFNIIKLIAHCDTKYYAVLHFDSYYAPTFAEKCVKVLENNTNAVLAYPYCQFIDENNNFLDIYKESIPFDQEDPIERYLGILSRMGWCTAYHSVIRHKVLVKHIFRTAYTNNAGFDNELLALLSLEGKLIQINAPLLYRLKDSYQAHGESFENHRLRLFAKNSYRSYPIKLPFCNFINDHCEDILNSTLSPDKKDFLIQNTIKILLNRYKDKINFELNRLINLIISGNFRFDEFEPEEPPSGDYKYLDFFILSKLIKEMSLAFQLLPTFPKINFAYGILNMYLGKHSMALYYIEQELLLNPNDTLCLTYKNNLISKTIK
jgi:glycosyltransferase involved in cell wall biosynthesis